MQKLEKSAPLILFALGAILLLLFALRFFQSEQTAPIADITNTPKPSRTAEPIYPSRTIEAIAEITVESSKTHTPVPPTVANTETLEPATLVPTETKIIPTLTNTAVPTIQQVVVSDTATALPIVVPPTVTSIPPTLIPTPWPTKTPWPTNTATPLPTPTPWPTKTPWPSPTATLFPTPIPVAAGQVIPAPSYMNRFGIGGNLNDVPPLIAQGMPIGAFLNWALFSNNVEPSGAIFWPMIRLEEAGMKQSWEQLERAVRAQPNATFLVGNEMDVKWQDNVTAPRYAVLYHDIYYFIKNISPTANVAIGGVSQPTPLRRQYLDIVLDTYQSTYNEKMPIDVWNVHGFILREERGSWGVDIPPGFSVDQGTLYEIEDHANIDIFRQNLVDFRAWMVQRGYGNKPLLVSEYGILMPPDFGFAPDVTAKFMTDTFDVMMNTANNTGYAQDNNRIVQWLVWYSIFDQEPGFPAGNLLDRETGQLTEVGQAWKNYFQ